eukprot:COSAG05_NODE_95_length_19507_cov_71.031791_10_plen_191_part_00
MSASSAATPRACVGPHCTGGGAAAGCWWSRNESGVVTSDCCHCLQLSSSALLLLWPFLFLCVLVRRALRFARPPEDAARCDHVYIEQKWVSERVRKKTFRGDTHTHTHTQPGRAQARQSITHNCVDGSVPNTSPAGGTALASAYPHSHASQSHPRAETMLCLGSDTFRSATSRTLRLHRRSEARCRRKCR